MAARLEVISPCIFSILIGLAANGRNHYLRLFFLENFDAAINNLKTTKKWRFLLASKVPMDEADFGL